MSLTEKITQRAMLMRLFFESLLSSLGSIIGGNKITTMSNKKERINEERKDTHVFLSK